MKTNTARIAQSPPDGRRARGFTLLELMIALTIGMLLMLGIMTVFIGNSAAEKFSNHLSEVQSNGRLAIAWLKHDLLMAGGQAMTYNPSTIRSTSVAALEPDVTGNCFSRTVRPSDWALGILPQTLGDPTPSVYGVDGSSDALSVFGGCLSAEDMVADSDVISIHYVQADTLQASDLIVDGIYVHSGLGGSVVFQCTVAGVACLAGLTDRRTDATGIQISTLVSHLYYVRKWNSKESDNIATLVRVVLQPDGSVTHESLISNVRTLQALYGFDTDEDNDIDQYRSASQLASPSTAVGLSGDWLRVKSVRLGMLLESPSSHGGITGSARTLVVEGVPVEVTAGHMGRVFSTSVAIRNPGRASGV